MNERQRDARSPAERVDDLAGILEAIGKSVREALLRHKQAGNPIAVWRDGAVAWIPAEEIVIDDGLAEDRQG
jgi:hypothetical protein